MGTPATLGAQPKRLYVAAKRRQTAVKSAAEWRTRASRRAGSAASIVHVPRTRSANMVAAAPEPYEKTPMLAPRLGGSCSSSDARLT